MKRLLFVLGLLLTSLTLSHCSDDDNATSINSSETPDHALFVVNAGNYNSSNASLTLYDPSTGEARNEVFATTNGFKLGDTAQSMTIHNNTGWVVVNNSHVVFALDLTTLKERGRLTDIHSPRYIAIISDTKGYISHLWSNKLTVFNPQTCKVTGSVTIPDMVAESGSTEEMVYQDGYLYVTCWSYHKRIVKIDTKTDTVVGEVEVGIQPTSLVADCNRKLWALCDGGYEGSPVGYEAPTLCRIDPETMTVEKRYTFTKGDYISKVRINDERNILYWLNGGALYRMSIHDDALPSSTALDADGYLYALSIDPQTGDIYVADAIDYQQQGIVYRYSAAGKIIDSFYAGIIPTEFAWR